MAKKDNNRTNEEEPLEVIEGEVVQEAPEPGGPEEPSMESEDLESLHEQLSTYQKQAEEYLDGWQRSRAEFANYKKRVERDQAQMQQAAAGRVIKRFLEVVDDLERALKNRPQDGEEAAWADGIELIYRKLMNFLESEGVVPIEAEGEMFDPNLHEAITSEESNTHESGQIIEVMQRGYMLGDRVLRPAMVRVAR